MKTSHSLPDDYAPSGFTLAELLLGLTLFTLAATLWQPLFAGAKVKADSTVCQERLHRLGRAIQLAAQDNDNTYPAIEPSPDNPIHPPAAAPSEANAARKPIKGLLDTLRPYGITPEEVQCPADLRSPRSYYAQKGSSYMWLPYVENERVDRPAAAAPIANGNGNPRRNRAAAPASRQRLLTDFDAVHDQRMNVLYADGHVKLY